MELTREIIAVTESNRIAYFGDSQRFAAQDLRGFADLTGSGNPAESGP